MNERPKCGSNEVVKDITRLFGKMLGYAEREDERIKKELDTSSVTMMRVKYGKLKQENEELVGALNNWAKSEELLKKENEKLRDEIAGLESELKYWRSECGGVSKYLDTQARLMEKFEKEIVDHNIALRQKLRDLVTKWRSVPEVIYIQCAKELEELLK